MHVHVNQVSARRLTTAIIITTLALALAVPAASAAPKTKLMSQSTGGEQVLSPGKSLNPDISSTGNMVVFQVDGDLLDGGDTNGLRDIYRRIASKKKTKLVSRAHDGGLADSASSNPRISANGRYVVFSSDATDLTPAKTDGTVHVYRRDLGTGVTKLVSRGAKGRGNGDSYPGDVSATGRYVVFHSQASNLTTKDTHGERQVYLRDMKKKKTVLISQTSKGVAFDRMSRDPVVSADGRFVAFMSAPDLPAVSRIYLRDREAGKTVFVSKNRATGKIGNGNSSSPAMSADGRIIVFDSSATNLIPGGTDTNGDNDVFRYDRVTKKMKRVSLNWKGRQLNGESYAPDISADGRVIVFSSDAKNTIRNGANGNDQVYRRGPFASSIKLVSRNNAGKQGTDDSDDPKVSANGRYVTFASYATNLTNGYDDNGTRSDIFRRGPF